ncbi:868_t:CDS:2, partial [Ambispora leptoticha]
MSRGYQLIVPKRREGPRELDATKLEFEFNNVPCLFNSEVCLLLERLDHTWNNLSMKFMEHLGKARTNKFRDRESAAAIRRELSQHHKLHSYELAQLCNLCPVELDEAKMLIPS